VARNNSHKGKGGPQQQNGASSHKRPNLTQVMHPNKNYYETKFFYWGKLGHIARECRENKYHEEQQKPKIHTGHLANGDQVQNLRLFMAYCDENVDVDIWCVDSGASTHMIGNKH